MESETVTGNGKRPIGMHARMLICYRISSSAIPQNGGIGDALAFLSDPSSVKKAAREATDWVFAAIDAVKASPDCPWQTDEEIASAILAKINERERGIGKI